MLKKIQFLWYSGVTLHFQIIIYKYIKYTFMLNISFMQILHQLPMTINSSEGQGDGHCAPPPLANGNVKMLFSFVYIFC